MVNGHEEKNSAKGYVTFAKSSFHLDDYLPILLFDFGTGQQTILVLLRQDDYKAFVKFLYKKPFSLRNGTQRREQM